MIFSGQRLGQEAAGRTGQSVSATVPAAAVSPVAGIASGFNQAIPPAKVAVIAPGLLVGSSIAGTTAASAGGPLAPVCVAKAPVVGIWIGNKAVKLGGNQAAVNKWQEGLVTGSSDVAKSVGNQTGKTQHAVGQSGNGPASRSSSSWW